MKNKILSYKSRQYCCKQAKLNLFPFLAEKAIFQKFKGHPGITGIKPEQRLKLSPRFKDSKVVCLTNSEKLHQKRDKIIKRKKSGLLMMESNSDFLYFDPYNI